MDRELVGDATVVAPQAGLLEEPEDREVASPGRVFEAYTPRSDFKPLTGEDEVRVRPQLEEEMLRHFGGWV